jgi:arsenate reductase-like glutaredoxin family protein
MTCKKAQGYLAQNNLKVKEVADASKYRQGREEASALARQVSTIIAAKGNKVVTFDMNHPPDEETLLAHLLGPTGNLRAPAIRKGKTLLVGFNADAYQAVLGS